MLAGLIADRPPSPVDALAADLAAAVGLVWSDFSDHPGYQKYVWRERARDLLGAEGPIEPAAEWCTPAPRFLA